MKGHRASFDLPDTRKGALKLRKYILTQGRKRHARSFEELAAQFVLERLDGIAQ
jgi:hypothetical protein